MSAKRWTFRSSKSMNESLKHKGCQVPGCNSTGGWLLTLLGYSSGGYCTRHKKEMDNAWTEALGA